MYGYALTQYGTLLSKWDKRAAAGAQMKEKGLQQITAVEADHRHLSRGFLRGWEVL